MVIENRGKLIKFSSSDYVKPKFKIEDDEIKMNRKVKYLGVQVDQQ